MYFSKARSIKEPNITFHLRQLPLGQRQSFSLEQKLSARRAKTAFDGWQGLKYPAGIVKGEKSSLKRSIPGQVRAMFPVINRITQQ